MRKSLLAVALASATMLGACSQVAPGHVGIRVNNIGSDAGVEKSPVQVGWYFTGFGQHIYVYPVSTQTYAWTASATEGKQNTNEEFSFQDNQGLPMTADVGVSFSVDPSKAPILFQKYRLDTQGIIDGPLRNAVRDALTTISSNYRVDQIAGPQKAQLIAAALNQVQSNFNPYGLRVERLYWASNIRLPDSVKNQIEGKITAEQRALQEQANVAVVKAQADQDVARSQGKAQAINIEGAALRANPEVIQMRKVEKWDGRLPQVTSGGTPLIDMK